MKKIHSYLIILIISYSLPAQVVNIPDPVFKSILLSANESNNIAKDVDYNSIAIDANQNNEIELNEALSVASLGISDDNLNTLTGIEAFSNLKTLWLSSNSLSSLGEVQQMTNLEYLEFDCNSIASIELNQMHSLNYLRIGINTPITEIDLCGTSVFSLWCLSHPTLQTINFKNNVVSGLNMGQVLKGFPPPLPNIWLENATALQNVCYDEGEYPAIISTLNPELLPNITFTTNCNSSCMLANQQSFENGFTIWPNPVIDTFQIEWPTNVNSFCLTLYNQLGQLIKKTIPSTNPTLFDISDLSKGVYYLDINSENTKTTKQIVKL